MGTEVVLSFSSLRAELENEKNSLLKIDENIKKIVQTSGRFSNDRFQPSGDFSRGGARPGGGRYSYPDVANFNKTEDGLGKRKQETKTVFSRLSARTSSDNEEEEPGTPTPSKVSRARVVSAVSRSLPSRAAVLRAQTGDDAARTRNRRIFGSLLGTLHKFKQEEITLQTKEEKKAMVERKIEEQARLERERGAAERRQLFAARDQRKQNIRALEAKLARVNHFDTWQASQRPLSQFILTKSRPRVYWLPALMDDRAHEKLQHSRRYHDKCMAKKRQELEEELQRIEQRVLRKQWEGAAGAQERTQDGAHPRDKFARHGDDSDHERDHEHPQQHGADKNNDTFEPQPAAATETTETTPAARETTEVPAVRATTAVTPVVLWEPDMEMTYEPPPPGTEDLSFGTQLNGDTHAGQ